MKNTAFLEQSPVRVAELTRMKRLATALLLVVTIIYIISAYFEPAYLWVGYVNAMAEAAMIGAIADWFAVTALFRRPMNLPIPHTAIIPVRKDDIARRFGEFVQSNFLSDQVITDKISSLALCKSVATWITRPENARAVADQIAAGLAGITNVLDDKNIQALIEYKVVDKIRTTSFAPMIGDLMTFITSGKRQQDLIDGAVRLGLYMLEDSDEQIRDRVSKETPWWFPGSVDKAIYHRIVRSVSKMLYDMQVDLYHPIRAQLITSINQFLDDLRHSEEIRVKEASLKEDLLQAPAVVNFTGSLWRDIKSLLQTQKIGRAHV